MPQPLYAGIDFGGTSIKLGLIDQEGKLLHSLERSTPVTEGYQEAIETFDTMLKSSLATLGSKQEELLGVGIGVPGFVQLGTGVVLKLTNLPWKDVPLKRLLQEKWNLPIEVDNDANVAALGEMWVGAGRGRTNILCITIGTGIGGGIIINGDIYHGVNGSAGEVGHFTVRDDQSARRCNCGKLGCLETEASATAIVNDALAKVKQLSTGALKEEYDKSGTLSAKAIIHLAQKGDRTSVEIISKTAQVLGKALSEMCCLLNPEMIVIGGGVSMAGDILFQPLKRTFYASALPLIRENTSIVPASLGNKAGMIGAARLVHSKCL